MDGGEMCLDVLIPKCGFIFYYLFFTTTTTTTVVVIIVIIYVVVNVEKTGSSVNGGFV